MTTTNARPPTLPCGCVAGVARCPVAAALWETVESRRAASRGETAALGDLAAHMREQWAWWAAQRAAEGVTV